MRKSEVFENFLKIAAEKDMIPLDAPDKAKKKLENDPRADSLSVSDIEALYGVKPNLPKSMEYEHNIMEDAHPNSLIISPSHDKINGLIENENERQNISIHWINKYPMPDGQLMNPKYAQQQLIMSLVRLGNELDNKNQDELRVLADTCLQQVAAAQMKKVAILPLAAGIAAAIGALYVQQHMDFINEGFEKNHQKLIGEIEDLLNSSSSWGVGVDYTAQFKQMAQDFHDKLMSFYNLYKQVEPLIVDMEKPRTAKELMQQAQQPQTDTAVKAYEALRKTADNMLPYLAEVKRNFSSETYKSRQVQEKGFLSSLLDKAHVLHGGSAGLVADDFDDVARGIDPYVKSIGDMLKVFNDAKQFANKAHEDIVAGAATSHKEFGDEAGTAAAPATKPVVPSGGAKEIDQQVEGLGKDLEEEFPELAG